MTDEYIRQARKYQQLFKQLNKFVLLLWRLGLGGWMNAWPEVMGRVMVITHTGRKTGLRRRTPVNYAIVDGEIYCMAGFGKISDWYRNIVTDPNIEVWLPDGWWQGTVEQVSDPVLRVPLVRAVVIGSGFAGYLFGLNPHRMTDQELATATAPYCLMHIRRTAARTGAQGPGDLAWVWPLATMILLPLVFLKKRRK